MGAICSICNSVRMDGRTKCKCGATKHTYTRPTLNLRCSWCKELFVWTPVSLARINYGIPNCCTRKCRASLATWERNRKLK